MRALDLAATKRENRARMSAAKTLIEGSHRRSTTLRDRVTGRDEPRAPIVEGLLMREHEEARVDDSRRNPGKNGLFVGQAGMRAPCEAALHLREKRATRDAIRLSGRSPNDIDFVNAHGTATRANDNAEARVMREVFGDRKVPISSMKSMLGHCMGAASAIEAIACIMTIEKGIYPPTIGYETPDPECDVAVVANVAKHGKHDVVLNNSAAFGGYNAVTCFARPGFLPPPSERKAPGLDARQVALSAAG